MSQVVIFSSLMARMTGKPSHDITSKTVDLAELCICLVGVPADQALRRGQGKVGLGRPEGEALEVDEDNLTV